MIAKRNPADAGSGRAVRWTVPPEEANLRLDRLIPIHVPEASRAQAKRWIEQGRVQVEGKLARPSLSLRQGETIVVEVPPPEPTGTTPEAISLDIVHEDEDLLVVNKPPHLVVHPAPGHRSGTLVNALLHHCPDLRGVGDVMRPGIVHRLDRGTSGLLVVAKHDRAHRNIARQFAQRTVEKRYLALVYGQPRSPLRIDKPLGRDRRHRTKISSRSTRAKSAITVVTVKEQFPLTTLLWVRIETGRTHQIRVHLAEAGFPIVGDSVYEGGRAFRVSRKPAPRGIASVLKRMDRPALHAAFLSFVHPRSGEVARFEAELPEDFQRLLEELRKAQGSNEHASHKGSP